MVQPIESVSVSERAVILRVTPLERDSRLYLESQEDGGDGASSASRAAGSCFCKSAGRWRVICEGKSEAGYLIGSESSSLRRGLSPRPCMPSPWGDMSKH